MKIKNYEFTFVETIETDLNQIYKPQEKYKKAKQSELHEYGNGDFCTFKLKKAKDICGVYAWVINGEVIYIGETVNFKKRFNNGYGRISPRNCYKGGQKTNCKMNQVVLKTYKSKNKIDIYFLETADYKAVEKDLLNSINTIYNEKNNNS